MEVDGNLKVTGTIQSADSLNQRIAELEFIIAQLQAQIALLQSQMSLVGSGYADCFGVVGGNAVIDDCGVCNGNNESMDACGLCGGDAISEEECYISDIDGNTYKTIWIGEQLWMTENLKVTQYNDGSQIPTGYSNSGWYELENGAYAVYPTDDDEVSQSTCGDDCADVYGNLYNWYVVDDDRGVCPDGWHVPSDEEFLELEMFLGMSEEEANNNNVSRGTDEGSKLASNSDLWMDGNLENNSEFGTSGFNAIPAGKRYSGGSNSPYSSMSTTSYFWTSSEISSTYAVKRIMYYYDSTVYRYTSVSKHYGISVRCIQN